MRIVYRFTCLARVAPARDYSLARVAPAKKSFPSQGGLIANCVQVHVPSQSGSGKGLLGCMVVALRYLNRCTASFSLGCMVNRSESEFGDPAQNDRNNPSFGEDTRTYGTGTYETAGGARDLLEPQLGEGAELRVSVCQVGRRSLPRDHSPNCALGEDSRIVGSGRRGHVDG